LEAIRGLQRHADVGQASLGPERAVRLTPDRAGEGRLRHVQRFRDEEIVEPEGAGRAKQRAAQQQFPSVRAGDQIPTDLDPAIVLRPHRGAHLVNSHVASLLVEFRVEDARPAAGASLDMATADQEFPVL
jgi:hypothetical protein